MHEKYKNILIGLVEKPETIHHEWDFLFIYSYVTCYKSSGDYKQCFYYMY
jgi:hypothetical protein